MKGARKLRLEKKGYRVTTVINTGNVVVTDPRGFKAIYSSVTEAHRRILGY